MINIYLDDLRPCPNGFVLAGTKRDCMKLLDENEVNILSLDHDLGHPMFGNGYDVAMYIVEQKEIYNNNIWPREIYLHTDNPVGRQNMFQLLDRWKPDNVIVKSYPFNK